MNLIIEKCLHCKKSDVRFDRSGLIDGEVFQFDLCLDCDDMTGQMMTKEEAFETLMRLVNFNDSLVYGGDYDSI